MRLYLNNVIEAADKRHLREARTASSRSRILGIRNVEHEYLYIVHGADDATRRGCLDKAYALGRQS